MPEFSGHVYIGVSLDGNIARPDGGLDWLVGRGAEESVADGPAGFGAFMDSVDGLIMGRATYEAVLGMGIEWPYGSKPVFVLSSTLDEGSVLQATVVVVRSVEAALDAFAAAGFTRAYVDGGSTIQEFLRRGLIDRLIISVAPVLIGDGAPLFGSLASDVELDLIRTEAIGGGFVQSEYRVQRN